MARKTREEKLQEQIDHLENVLESFESRQFAHVKHIYLTADDEFYLTAREYRGKKYARLNIAPVDRDEQGNEIDPPAEEVAARNEDDQVKVKYVAPSESHLEIVKTLTLKEAHKYFDDKLKRVKAEMDNLFENAPVPKAPLKAERQIKARKVA